MDYVTAGLLERHPWVPRRLLTVDDYHRMGEVGILGPEERIELIEGELVLMAPIGSKHAGSSIALNHLLVAAVGGRALVSVGNPERRNNRSEPHPDACLLRPRADFYRTATPKREDVLLAIELSQSSLDYDRRVKRELYARHGIVEFWIVDLRGGAVEVCRDPKGDDYAGLSRAKRGAVLEPAALPGAQLAVADILG